MMVYGNLQAEFMWTKLSWLTYTATPIFVIIIFSI